MSDLAPRLDSAYVEQTVARLEARIRARFPDRRLGEAFTRVINLVEPPTSLARPSVVARVSAASVTGRWGRAPVVHPRVGPPPT